MPRRTPRLRTMWIVGAALEAVLVGVVAILFVQPDPPIVARLQGETTRAMATLVVSSDDVAPDSAAARGGLAVPRVPEDSFFTVLHWPLHKPLLEGGGRVLSFPMRLLWVPFLYLFGIPALLVTLTLASFAARWLRPGDDPPEPGLEP